MDLQKYVADAEKRYRFRLRSVVPLDDAAMDKIERALAPFMPIEISAPHKMMFQSRPLDFANIANAEVFLVDVVTGLPVAPHIMAEHIRKALKAPDDYVVVRGENEPGETYAAEDAAELAIDAEGEKQDLVPGALLSTDPDYVEASPVEASDYYGDAYNAALLGYLKTVEDERPTERVAPSPLFSYLDLPDTKPAPSFNDDIPDAPRVAPPMPTRMPKGVLRPVQGGVQTADRTMKRVWQTDKGERRVLSRPVGEGDAR